jgi:hypothetical protein
VIKISLKGLAQFMTASSAQQRKILRDFKYPDPEGSAKAMYYREARDFIAAYHSKGHPRTWLADQADVLSSLAAASSGRTVTRLRHNARALREYESGWAHMKLEVLNDVTMALLYGTVRVTVVPDLHVRQGGRSKIMKLEFGVEEPDRKTVAVMTQGMFEAASASSMALAARDVLYIDIPRGKIHQGARVGSRLATEIVAACKNIEAIWPTL